MYKADATKNLTVMFEIVTRYSSSVTVEVVAVFCRVRVAQFVYVFN